MMVGQRKNLWLLAGLLGFYLIMAAVLPAADDEIYYWAWARPLQFSYYDHPPLTAYMIRLSTDIFGDSIFGFRVPACLATAFVLLVIAHLSKPKSLLPGIVLTPLFTLGAVLITPDTPLLCFWAAYVWWLVEVHRRLTPVAEEGQVEPGPASLPWWMWLVGGVLLGCGVLGKYTMALAVPAGFASFCLVWRLWKRWLPGYIAHGVVAFAVASPILIFNIQQNFAPLLFQWRHTMTQSQPGIVPFGEFVGVQLLLFGTLPFFLYPWVLWSFRRLSENPRLRVCACLYALPMTFFLYKATQARLQGNWALVMFVSFWPLAAAWYQTVSASRFWRWSTASAFIIPVACVALLTGHLLYPIPFIPAEGDRVTRQYALNEATHQIAETIHQRGEALPVFTTTYQITAWLRFQSLDGRQIDQISRPSHFTQHPEHLADVTRAYVVADFPLPPEFAPGFGEPELVGNFPVKVRGEAVRDFKLYLYSKSIAAKRRSSGVAMVNHEELLAGPAPLSEVQTSELPVESELNPANDSSEMSLRLQILKMRQPAFDELGLKQHVMHTSSRPCDEKLNELKRSGKAQLIGEQVMPLIPDQTARFLSGGEFPVPVPVSGGEVEVEWREFGTEFEATATPSQDGELRLKLYFSVSDMDPRNAVEISGISVPGISRRRIQSTIIGSLNDPHLTTLLVGPNQDEWTLFRYELVATGTALRKSQANAKSIGTSIEEESISISTGPVGDQ
jgi:hypothetical protein